MKVRIGNNEAIDGSDEALIIIFDDDQERLHIIDLLTNMEAKEGVRMLAEWPQYMEFSKEGILDAEAKKHNQ